MSRVSRPEVLGASTIALLTMHKKALPSIFSTNSYLSFGSYNQVTLTGLPVLDVGKAEAT